MHAHSTCSPALKALLVAVIAVELVLIAVLSTRCTTQSEGGAEASQAGMLESNDVAQGEDVAPEPVTLTVTFAGDCTLGTDPNFSVETNFNTRYEEEGEDPTYFLKNVADIFAADDLTVVNMEGTLTEQDTPADKTFTFKGPKEYTKILSSASVEAASLANNHSRDFGEQSYTDTIEALEADGIPTFGYDRIAYQDVKGVKVALIGASTIGKTLEDDAVKEMLANIETARSEGAQLVLVFVHWGIERDYVPQESDMQVAHAAIDAGADLVVGSHPHVVQGWEVYEGRYIVYSLGNFCFGGNSNPEDKDCIVFQQTFTVTGGEVAKDGQVKIIPCSISSSSERNDYQPTPADGEEKARIEEKIQDSTDQIAEMAQTLS